MWDDDDAVSMKQMNRWLVRGSACTISCPYIPASLSFDRILSIRGNLLQ